MGSVTAKPHARWMSSIEQISKLAARQHGVVHRHAILEAGFKSGQLDRMVGRGLLRRVGYETYLFPGAPPTWHLVAMLLMTAAGAQSAASHQTAAYLQGLIDRRPSRIEVVTPRWRRSRAVDFTVHESLDLSPEHVTAAGGIRLTKPVRTVVDLGASAPWMVEPALDAGIRQRLFTLPDVAGFVGRVAKRGRRGVGVIRPLIEQRVLWDGVTDSELEDLLRREWADRQPPLVPQHIITNLDGEFVCRTDFAFVDHKSRIELDSEAFHMDRKTFRRDRVIQNQTELLGWRTFRYTWWDLTARPFEVVNEIETALRDSTFMRP